MKRLMILFLIILGNTTCAFSQKQTHIWYFGENVGLDFNHSPPVPLGNSKLRSRTNSAVMSDSDGNLLFYTDGKTVWNKNHAIMLNGENLDGSGDSRRGTFIIPYPENKYQYYIFNYTTKKGLNYSVVDIRLDSGLGGIIEKNIVLNAGDVYALGVIGKCTENGIPDEFWVVSSGHNIHTVSIDYPRKILAFQVDGNGIRRGVVVSEIIAKPFYCIKFSPAGNKAALMSRDHVYFAHFDIESGRFELDYKYFVSDTEFDQVEGEFSPDGKYFYLASTRMEFQGSSSEDHVHELIQLDTESPQDPVVEKIFYDKDFRLKTFQLAPDGNIYIARPGGLDTNNRQFLARIINTNSRGLSGKFEKDGVFLGGGGGRNWIGLPAFSSHYFYNGLLPYAGEDQKFCAVASFELGNAPVEGEIYSWSPGDFLSKPDVSNPYLEFYNDTDKVQTKTYVLTVSNEVCTKKDTVVVTVYPAPPEDITGSRSVCPGVEDVGYRVPKKEGYSYRWEVEGGVLTKGQDTEAIHVTWGPSNQHAKVVLHSTNIYGCEPVTLELPVKIQVELEPETPRGPERVCYNQKEGVTYEVTQTTGSIYTWFLEGGTIAQGQGTSKVKVNWKQEGTFKIWLQEESTTIDTVCVGTSETLLVEVYKDDSEIFLDLVSVYPEDENYTMVKVNPEALDVTSTDLVLYRRKSGSDTWEELTLKVNDSLYFIDGKLETSENIYEYRIASRNNCDEPIGSNIQRTILLQGSASEETNEVSLQWNSYTGWKKGVAGYEIWRRSGTEEKFSLRGIVDSQRTTFIAADGEEDFNFEYRIVAVEHGTGFNSYSNTININFEHDIFIPNVFTPNGDGMNDSFEITKLEMYPDNLMVIYDRYGSEVYRKRGYQGEWTGAALPDGVYYYYLKLFSPGKQYKGWVKILR
jgi:gliding motility-associated-like protein